jgi:hypothetical protein
MRRRAPLLLASALLALALPAAAQEAGGLRIAPEAKGGPVGLARPLPGAQALITAHDLQGTMAPADRQALHQNMITRLRGDPGFLSGFSFGQPNAASRQQEQAFDDSGGFAGSTGHRHHHQSRPIVINNQGPLALTVGNGNTVQQQSAITTGPVAQQQIAGPGQAGALNLVTGAGNILQRSPATR